MDTWLLIGQSCLNNNNLLYLFFRFSFLSLHRDTYYWYHRNPTLQASWNSNQPTEWSSSYKTAAETISILTQLKPNDGAAKTFFL